MFKCVIMGVSGSGKTSIGKALSLHYGATFLDGDLLHLKANIDKMAGGVPLNDEDRAPWLSRISDVFYASAHLNTPIFIACSCLKKAYRDYLRSLHKDLYFLYLKGDKATILAHMQNREGHFMKESLLNSQFSTLEEPDESESNVFSVSIKNGIDATLEDAIRILDKLYK